MDKFATITIRKTYDHPAYGQLFESFTSGLAGQYVNASTRTQVDEFIGRIQAEYSDPHWVIKNGERVQVVYHIEVMEI